jgi:acylglycerol lipase
MGHSMGGGEILQYAAVGPVDVKTQITGFIGSAPFIRVGPGSEPNKLTVIVGRLASKVLPHHQLVQKLNSSYMCHDAAMCKDWENDPLCHDTGTLEGLTGMLDRAEQLDKGKVVIEDRDGLHLFIAHGIDDKVTSHEASKSFIERSPVKDKTLQLYDGSYHCSEFFSGFLWVRH